MFLINVILLLSFFFFKQKTAYEMRISDWSSDVCSSDLTLQLPPPAAGQVLLRQTAIGLNYIDTYHRSGLYPLALPSGLGCEGAGEVVDVGDGVGDLRPGDRVARSEEHTSELQSLMRISYAVFCLKKKNSTTKNPQYQSQVPQA